MEYYKNFSLEPLFYINDEGLVCQEEFRDVAGYEGLYQVSDLGRVKSLKRKFVKKDLILNYNNNSNRYVFLNLYKNTIVYRISIHQLVAMAFLNHIPCKHEWVVDHIDNNSLNNTLANLQIITHRKNTSKDIKNKTSKYTGVNWDKDRNKWVSFIRIEKERFNLGRFETEKEASEAYQKALKYWEENKIKPIIIKNYTSKHKGIFFNKKIKKWILNIYLGNNKKRTYIGCYNTEEEAFKKAQEIKKTVN